MKSFIKTIFLLALILISLTAETKSLPEIVMSADLKKTNPSSYSINYSISLGGVAPSDFMDQSVYYPLEMSILEGMVMDGQIKEKDFIYSERNVDLNNDGDTDDVFPVSLNSGNMSVSGRVLMPIFKKSNGTVFIIPNDKNNRENLARFSENGLAFTLHNVDPVIGRITVGLGDPGKNVTFQKFPNSLLIIEIIQSSGIPVQDGLMVNDMKPGNGFTNERIFSSGGEISNRYSAAINVAIDNASGSGKIKIENLTEKFKVRLRYCFSISSRAVLISEKILTSENR